MTVITLWAHIPVSPLVRGEWIEITVRRRRRWRNRSPLVRGEWIEIPMLNLLSMRPVVSPRERGVD